jgi:hypothetical protein
MAIIRTSALALYTIVSVAGAQTPPGVHIVRQIELGGEGRWDAITVDTFLLLGHWLDQWKPTG